MFDNYKHRVQSLGGNLNNYLMQNSQSILDFKFDTSTTYKKVLIDGEEFEARIIADSRTTIRSGLGNYVIQFKNNLYFKAGTYVDIPIKDEYVRWMIIYEDDDTLFEKPIIKKCNYKLKWKNSSGDIIERDAVFSDNIRMTASTFEVQRGKANLPNHYKILLLPFDNETINLQRGKRFIIDICSPELLRTPDVYEIVNRNIITKINKEETMDGVVEMSVAETQFNPNTDNAELMIADYYLINNDEVSPPFPIQPTNGSCFIKSKGTLSLSMGLNYKEYWAEFYDGEKLLKNITCSWNVLIDDKFIEYFNYKIDNNKLFIKCDYSPLLINSHILLQVHDESNTYVAEKSIKVVSVI